jgi:1,2-dihydroxy-3-keto-5-methylthiopentene dioxygenase
MTQLTQYDDTVPFSECARHHDFAAIAAAVAPSGVTLERWQTNALLSAEPGDAEILAVYAADVARLKARGGYQSCDVIRLTPSHPDRAALRTRFLAEHVHDDDEVRFFVEGAGMFYIRAGGKVHALECTAGDLIVLPAGTTHWFDMGDQPRFTAIRLFNTPDGWIARYTGNDIAKSIPLYQGIP